MIQLFKNLSVDPDVTSMIPRHLVALEVVAASSVIAEEIAGDKADRHTYLIAVPRYIASLPGSIEEAVSFTKQDAARVLSIPGLATDAALLSQAQERLAMAQAEVESAAAIQGRRMAAIYRHEQELVDAQRELESWTIDFAAEEKEAEDAILASWGKSPVGGRMSDLTHIPILKKLQPIALGRINTRIAEAEAALALLHAPETNRKPKL